MKPLKELLRDAGGANSAVGHFNFATIEVAHAIARAAYDAQEPVILGTSEGERKFVGVREAVALVRAMRESYALEDGTPAPIYLNADHTYSVEGAKEAIDAGYDMVIFDGAELSFEENVSKTKEVVDYARSVNSEIVVEGELGYIGKSSKLRDEVPEEVLKAGKTTPEEAAEFVEATGVDAFAPSVGNLHGIVKGAGNPDLDAELIGQIAEAAAVPLVLHGGSGIKNEEFRAAIRAGISAIHVSTEIRKAWREALEGKLGDDADELAPYRILKPSADAAEKVVAEKLQLFRNF